MVPRHLAQLTCTTDMKRTGSPSRITSPDRSPKSSRTASEIAHSQPPSSSSSSAIPSSSSASSPSRRHRTMACSHLSDAFSSLNPPRPSQQVHRDECTLCFDDQDGPSGIDVCLICFNGGCTGNGDREHAQLHFQKTGHAIVANVKRRPKPRAPKEPDEQPKKLAIAAESDEDRYEWTTTPKCLACDATSGGKELPLTDKLSSVVSAMMKSLSSSQQSEVKAWEEEILPCDHTRNLVQPDQPSKLEPDGLAKCGKCDLTNNLWLCLTCGNLGCGRAQFGGVGGNSHGLTHFEETGHPVSVKQGTITAEGTADIYCYACNDARIDPKLADHLRHFGINVMDLSKTEKSMTELQLEQNLKFDFAMTGEDGKQLQPVFGPSLTGLKNLGNSCYLASTVQSIFSLPEFQSRYRDAYRPHTASCSNALPAACLECQMGKLADGLLSGRYSVPREPEPSAYTPSAAANGEDQKDEPIFQAGIRPSQFKQLIGKGHEEFSTMRQQDADEFLKHLVTAIQKECKRVEATQSEGAPTHDPTRIFSFGLEQRLQCTECKRVRYTQEAQDAGLSVPVPLRIVSSNKKAKAPAEGINATDESASEAATANQGEDKVRYEPVTLQECLDIFTASEDLEYACPACQKKVIATKQTLFTSFPDVLAIQVRRFQLVNWVPQKVDVPILVPMEPFDLDKYLGTGKRDDEEELPDTADASESAASSMPEFDVAAMSQLTSMGFPEVRCQRALLATGNTGDAEAAMNWLFAHMEDADIDDPIDFASLSSASSGGPGTAAAAAAAAGAASGPDTSTLEDMGFSRPQARKALRLNSNNPELAVAWLFENPEDPGEDEAPLASTSSSSGEPSNATTGAAVLGGSSTLPARYGLQSFISHRGPSVHSGHYVCHVKKPTSLITSTSTSTGSATTSMDVDTNPPQSSSSSSSSEAQEWVLFNDEKVVRAPFEAPAAAPGQGQGQGQGQSQTKMEGGGEEEVAIEQKEDVGVKGLSKLAYLYFFSRV